jgi:uncharacterized membrane protein YjgN (DUF898 family)
MSVMTTYWFRQKRFGYGATPVAWQGWVLTLAYAVIVGGCAALVPVSHLSSAALLAVAIVFIVATAVLFRWTYLKTEGGWRRRWGND